MRENKNAIFAGMEAEYMNLVNQQWNGEDYFKSWFSSELNNARLALINSYHGGICAFRNLYESVGGDILQFQQKASAKAVLDKQKRSAWLSQPCTAIASGGDL
jgi:predicted aminopeptidase